MGVSRGVQKRSILDRRMPRPKKDCPRLVRAGDWLVCHATGQLELGPMPKYCSAWRRICASFFEIGLWLA